MDIVAINAFTDCTVPVDIFLDFPEEEHAEEGLIYSISSCLFVL